MPFQNIPLYTNSPSVLAACNRITQPPGGIPYEHHVSTWAGTMLKKVFQSDNYTLSAEVIDATENKKPDYLIEKLDDQNKLVRYVYVELKKEGGQHFEKALYQATEYLQNTIEGTSETVKECFVVVQRGVKIGFFEYHARHEDLKHISNFHHCVSLTQVIDTEEDNPFVEEDRPTYMDPNTNLHPSLIQHIRFDNEKRNILPHPPQDLQQLSFGNYNGRDRKLQTLLRDARAYTTPCVFDITQHQREIDYLFYYMSVQPPRIIIPNP